MVRTIFATLFLVFSLSAIAQKKPLATPFAVPIDSVTKKITYEKVVEVKGSNANVLYDRMLNWFRSYYKNPAEVIRENDSLKFRIVGKPRYRLNTGSTKDQQIQYTITVAARDGRFRYELTDFNWKQMSYYACERWLDTQAKGYDPVFNDYLGQLDKMANEVIGSLIHGATHDKSEKDKDNW